MEPRSGYKQTEVGVIPNDWDVVSIGSLITDYRGGASLKPSDFTSTGVKVLPKGGVGRTGWLDVSNDEQKYCSPEYATANFRNQVDETYTIVVLRDLVPSGPSIGLIVRIRDTETYVLAQGVYGFKVNEKAVPGYLVHLSNTIWYRKLANSIMVGSTQVHITNTAYKKALIPLPPVPEQEAIDGALSDADALIEALEGLIAKKRQVKQGAMSELLSGKRRLSGFSDEWKIVPFESLCRTFTKQTGFDYSASIKPSLIMEHREGFLPFIQNKDFEGKNINYQTDYFVPEKIAVKFPRILLDEKCLLISISGSIGNVAIFSNLQTAFVGGAIAVGKFFNQKHLNWVLYYLQSYEGQNKFFGNVKAGSHHNLTLEDIRKVEIPMPSEEEQTAIAEILSDMDAEIAALEAKLSKARQVKQGMMQELLTGRVRLVTV